VLEQGGKAVTPPGVALPAVRGAEKGSDR
jgi:hypothetical protein